MIKNEVDLPYTNADTQPAPTAVGLGMAEKVRNPEKFPKGPETTEPWLPMALRSVSHLMGMTVLSIESAEFTKI